jgi:hypothetical protein
MIDNYEEEERKALMDHLLEIGAIEITGYDAISDQFTYNITPACEHLVPDLWEEHFKTVNEIAFGMWSEGLIEMKFDQDGVPLVLLKPEIVQIKDTLPDDQRFFIENLLRKQDNGDII